MSLLTDLRLGVRVFGRRPGPALAAIASLALGIGANTAIFSVLHHVVLAQLPFSGPDRLMAVWETGQGMERRWVAPANFVDWRRETTTFDSLAAFDGYAPTLTGRGEPERLRAVSASGTFFTTLGATPHLGRTLLPADDEAGSARVAVLADGLWQRLFGSSPAALGATLLLDGQPHTIVGVMPARFRTPARGNWPDTDVWLNGDRGVPRTFPFAGDATTVRDAHIINVVGRLAPGATRNAAQDELTRVMQTLATVHPDTNSGLGVNIVPLHEEVVGDVRPTVVLLQGAVGLLLLIACVNVAHLLLGQAASRQAEIATRASLGASRARLVRQLLAETLVIAVPAGALGLLFAAWVLPSLVALAPVGIPRLGEVALDASVLAFTLLTTLATAMAFGIGPALRLSRSAGAIGAQAHTRIAGARGVRRWHHALVITELALAQTLLIGAGLLLASFVASQRVDVGFASDGRIVASLSLAPERYLVPRDGQSFSIDPQAKLQFIDNVLTRLQSTPQVRSAAAAFTAPLTGAPNRGVHVEGRPAPGPGQLSDADFQVVSPTFFETIGIPLLRGRVFTDADRAGATPVATINRAFAERFFPGQEPLGQRLLFGERGAHEIVGIVADARYRTVEAAADPTFYVPLAQNDERWPFLAITAWSDTSDTATLAAAVRQAIREADPLQAISRLETHDDLLAARLAPRRFNALLVGLLALTALVLAAIGTYGVMASAVATRRREIGVRVALGASPRAIVGLLVGQSVVQCGIALVLGSALGLAANRVFDTMLYGVTPYDLRTMASVAAILATVALLATWLPARRATKVDPGVALREP